MQRLMPFDLVLNQRTKIVQNREKNEQKLLNLEKCETTIDRTKDGDYSAETDLFISLRSVVKSDKSRHD